MSLSYSMSYYEHITLYISLYLSVAFCAHTYLRPLDLEEGESACLLPWQRKEIRDAYAISAAVRPRGRACPQMQLSLSGGTEVTEEVFKLAEKSARAHVASNYAKGITSVTDLAISTKPAKKAKTGHDMAMFALCRLSNKDG